MLVEVREQINDEGVQFQLVVVGALYSLNSIGMAGKLEGDVALGRAFRGHGVVLVDQLSKLSMPSGDGDEGNCSWVVSDFLDEARHFFFDFLKPNSAVWGL